MDAMIYLGQENNRLAASCIKSHQRLQSAPEQSLKTPHKSLSGRKALGTVNKLVTTSAVSQKHDTLSKPSATQRCEVVTQPASEQYPEIETCFPYNPSDFEVYSVADEVCLSRFSLAGLGKQQLLSPVPDDFSMDLCLPLSPVKIPSENGTDDLTAFLETISELTIDLPPEQE